MKRLVLMLCLIAASEAWAQETPSRTAPASSPTNPPSSGAHERGGIPSRSSSEPSIPPSNSPTPAEASDTALPKEEAEPSPEKLLQQDLESRHELYRRGSFSLRLGALIQVQAAFYVGDDAAIAREDAADTEGFRIRRARFGIIGDLIPYVEYILAIDMKDTVMASLGGDHGSEIYEAALRWSRWQWLEITAGVEKVPFSAFSLKSSSRLQLIERPLMAELLAPSYRAGLTLGGQWRGLHYAAGLYNGSEGLTSGNRLAGLAGVTRLQLGLLESMNRGKSSGAELTVGASYMIDQTPSVRFQRVSGSLEAALWRFRLLGEMIWQASTPLDAPGDTPQMGSVRRWGAAGELSAYVYRDLLQLVARYEHFRDNEALPTFGRQQLITAGLNYYLAKDSLKLQINYVRRDELQGSEISNDTGLAQLQAMF